MAAVAELELVHDFEPGLSRTGSPGAFAYLDATGAPVEDAAVLARIAELAIPPAWQEVWIAPSPNAHLQATGIDSRGRKQYRYHAEWRHDRDELKYEDMERFGRAQPILRAAIERDLTSSEEPTHRRVLALSLRLLDVGLFRVGSDRYARDNHHFGLTTLLREQLTLSARQAAFDYVGKAGKRQRLVVTDPGAVAALGSLRRRRSGPAELLAFRGPVGWRRIHREDVNNFLRTSAQAPFSAKEYRTWNGTVMAALALAQHRPPQGSAAALASRAVAEHLGNTPAVARRSYIDPRVFVRYSDGTAIAIDDLPPGGWDARESLEARVLALLDQGE
jgi:DNA topoisomerase-1